MNLQTLIIPLACALVPADQPAAAQRTWPEPGPPAVAIDINKVFYAPIGTPDGLLRFGAPTSTITASSWFALSSRVALSVELPVSRMDERVGPTNASTIVVGDPWLGLEAVVARDLIWELGVRPGFVHASEDPSDTLARSNGVAADYDHYEAWRPGYRSLRSSANMTHTIWNGVFVGALAGVSVAWPTRADRDDDGSTQPDLYLLYGARLGLRRDAVAVQMGLVGRAYPTAHGPFTERTVNQLTFGVSTTSGRVRPAGEVRVYRDRFLEPYARAVVSVGVSVWR